MTKKEKELQKYQEDCKACSEELTPILKKYNLTLQIVQGIEFRRPN